MAPIADIPVDSLGSCGGFSVNFEMVSTWVSDSVRAFLN